MNQELLSVEKILENANGIEGWLSENERDILFNTVLSLKDLGSVVEIGSWCGRSLLVLAAAAIKRGFKNKIYSIDPFLTSKDEPNGKFEEFIHNLKINGVYDLVCHIKEKSQIAGAKFNDNIEFIFIDGLHKYEAVKRDFELFYPKIVDGGYIAFHDAFSFLGPTKLLSEIFEATTNLRYVDKARTLVLCQKVSELSDTDKVNNATFLDSLKKCLTLEESRLIK